MLREVLVEITRASSFIYSTIYILRKDLLLIDIKYYNEIQKEKDELKQYANKKLVNSVRFKRYREMFMNSDDFDEEIRTLLWAIHDMDDEEKAKQLIELTILFIKKGPTT